MVTVIVENKWIRPNKQTKKEERQNKILEEKYLKFLYDFLSPLVEAK